MATPVSQEQSGLLFTLSEVLGDAPRGQEESSTVPKKEANVKTVSPVQELWRKNSSRAEEDCQLLNPDTYLCPACIVAIIEIEACVPESVVPDTSCHTYCLKPVQSGSGFKASSVPKASNMI